jgi:hypothetical protein
MPPSGNNQTQFFELGAQTLRGIDEARDRLTDFMESNPPPTTGERRQVTIEKKRLDADWEKVYQQMLAVSQGANFASPTDADVQAARKIANDLDTITGNNLKIGNIINLATELMNIWTRTGVSTMGQPRTGNLA